MSVATLGMAIVLGSFGGLWLQGLNFFFFGAALFSDLLLLRICLALGYFFLMMNNIMGSPVAPDWYVNTSLGDDHLLLLDGLVWSVVVGFFHCNFVYHLLRDERHVKLGNEEEESIWRFFYRRSGMKRLEFLQVMRNAELLNFKAGDVIVDSDNSLQYFHLVLHGLVDFEASYNDVKSKSTRLHSGDFFDLEVANVFGVRLGFESDAFCAHAATPCRIIRWSFEDMNRMATHGPPVLSSFWRNMLLYSLASELNRVHPGMNGRGCLDSSGEPEDPSFFEKGAPSRDFTMPLLADEAPPRRTFMSTLRWMIRSIKPFPIPGLRHNAMPTSGVTARNRVHALRRAISEAGPAYSPSTVPLARRSLSSSMMRHVSETLHENGSASPQSHSSPRDVLTRAQKRLASVRRVQVSQTPPATPALAVTIDAHVDEGWE